MEISFLVDCLDFEQMFSPRTLTDVGFVCMIIFHFTDALGYEDNQSKFQPYLI